MTIPISKSTVYLVCCTAFVIAAVGILAGLLSIIQSYSLPADPQSALAADLQSTMFRLGIAEIVSSVMFGMFMYLVGGIALGVLDLWHDRFNSAEQDEEQLSPDRVNA